MRKVLLLALLLCGFMQVSAQTWTDDNGITWSFTVNGTEATDIKFRSGPNVEKIYIYGDPNRTEEEKAEDPQLPFVPGAWDAAAMRFSSTEGAHLPTIPDNVYFGLKTLIFDVSDVTPDFDLKVMNGWWSNTYYDHVKWVDGLNELPITEIMANECAKGGEGKDLDLMLYSGSMTFNAVYYESSTVSGAVVVPEKVYVGSTELTVTSIGDYAFSGCYNMTSVTIPSSVTSIGAYAFRNSGLTSVTIPEGVTSIGEGVFEGCTGLTSVTIPEGVTSIGDYAFDYCYNLTSVTIPSSVTSIGMRAISRCFGLTSITVASGNTVYDSRDNCNAIIETASNTLIQGCKNTVIPSSVTSIGDYAFDGCYNLTSVTIPEGVTSIGNYAFYDCYNLTSVAIPEGVTSIGNRAFNFSGLTSVIIPSSVTSIGMSAFAQCMDLTSITVASGNTVYDSRDNCNAIIETVSNTLIQGCKNTVIPSSVTSIGDYAFFNLWYLTSVTIPEGVTSIGMSAFEACYNLTSVNIGKDVTNIGWWAFYGCDIQDIYCYAISCPGVYGDTFSSYSSTLHVPEASLQQYKDDYVWGNFFEIVPIDESSAINEIGIEGIASEIEAIYDGNGQRQPALRRGINIIKMSDGTIKKVLVK